MKTIDFELDSPAEKKYTGSGWALAVIDNDKILDLHYLINNEVPIAPGETEEDALLGAALEFANANQGVHLGMCSGRTFCDPQPASAQTMATVARTIADELD